MSSSDIYLFRSRRKQVALAVRPSAVPNGIRSVPSGKSPCTGRVFACRRRERKPRIGAGGGTGPNLGRVHSAAVGRRRTADIGGGAISNFPGNGRTESSVSGETGRDPRLARKSPRSGNIRNAPKASGEGGRIFGPRTRCAGTKRPPRSAERIRRYRTRSAPCTQCAEKRKHPKHAERFRRRRARLRTSHAMCRDEKATGKRRTYPAIPNATRISHAMRREAETSETRRRLPEKVGASSDLARDVPGRKGHRETQNVSGDTGRDPHFARKSPRSGNIRNAPNAYGEGGPRNGRSRGAAATGSRTFSALRKKAFRGGGICFFRGKSLYLYDI